MNRRARRAEESYRAAERAMWNHHGLEPQERWVEVDSLGIRVRALEHGEGRPVLFIHGTPTAGGVFVPLVAQLPGVRSIVVDRPGCGLSEPLNLAGTTAERMRDQIVKWMAPLIAAVADGPVDVVASSAGGMAALVLAARRPDLVRTVALLGAPAIEGMNLPAWMRAATIPPLARAVARHNVNRRDLERSFKSMGHGPLVRNGGLSQEDLEWRYALSRDTHTYDHELRLMRLAATWRGPRSQWLASLTEVESLKGPSLWVAGERDPFATPERIRSWAAHAQDATLRVMPGAGHQPWIDRPGEHARLLEQWWKNLGAGALNYRGNEHTRRYA
ncbi:alpha/beta hydrolase [Demequina sp. TTPB684]|uniref:alpha/beta fold hydrolase n=1 Tax=unclassified Demequina TaxID=2620311 RepID=UPI001CF32974|nr:MULTISPECIES: alpha/beta hydrolase [unclassified Demequina]MCB2413460.1 alpha/beta hydrolase [Demequina sp. TTPB684]UPU88763.1 alpha/beta hydrolase [Demequina sp. TMPB413]